MISKEKRGEEKRREGRGREEMERGDENKWLVMKWDAVAVQYSFDLFHTLSLSLSLFLCLYACLYSSLSIYLLLPFFPISIHVYLYFFLCPYLSISLSLSLYPLLSAFYLAFPLSTAPSLLSISNLSVPSNYLSSKFMFSVHEIKWSVTLKIQ